eukprot:4641932-Pleurochrysis_carterae.AAC.4
MQAGLSICANCATLDKAKNVICPEVAATARCDWHTIGDAPPNAVLCSETECRLISAYYLVHSSGTKLLFRGRFSFNINYKAGNKHER